MSNPLYMHKIFIHAKPFYGFCNERKLLTSDCDEGYALHSFLCELFGEQAQKPFFVTDRNFKHLTLLAYSPYTKKELQIRASTFADPSLYDALDWECYSEKPLPMKWTENLKLGFQIKLCPIKRLSNDNHHQKPGYEKDAYLSYLDANKDQEHKKTRFEVYEEWGKEQLEKELALLVEGIKVKHFQLVNFQRRNKDREIVVSKRPEVIIHGTFSIKNEAQFLKILQEGIGRHRAFGFGMLLIQPLRS